MFQCINQLLRDDFANAVADDGVCALFLAPDIGKCIVRRRFDKVGYSDKRTFYGFGWKPGLDGQQTDGCRAEWLVHALMDIGGAMMHLGSVHLALHGNFEDATPRWKFKL
jgi:hypothetical protein